MVDSHFIVYLNTAYTKYKSHTLVLFAYYQAIMLLVYSVYAN